MSSHLEIMDVYLNDIVRLHQQVRGKPGWDKAMVEEMRNEGLTVHRLWDGVLSCEDEALLSRISDADRLAGEDAD
jgi:hypothetical protein